MSLRDAFDLSLVAQRFSKPVVFEEREMRDLDAIVEKNPGKLHHIGLTVWHQVVHRRLFAVVPQAIGPYVDSEDPLLFKRIDDLLGLESVLELYDAEARVDDDSLRGDSLCCELFLARTYPNDLVLGDVTFANPYRPLPVTRRRFEHQRYEGLGLLPELVRRLATYGEANGIERIVLTAASLDQVVLFKKHGFVVDGSEIARVALRVGLGIPMERVLRPK